jgi:hypothetical protein
MSAWSLVRTATTSGGKSGAKNDAMTGVMIAKTGAKIARTAAKTAASGDRTIAQAGLLLLPRLHPRRGPWRP